MKGRGENGEERRAGKGATGKEKRGAEVWKNIEEGTVRMERKKGG